MRLAARLPLAVAQVLSHDFRALLRKQATRWSDATVHSCMKVNVTSKCIESGQGGASEVQPVDRIHEWQHLAPIAAAVVQIMHSHAATRQRFATHDLGRPFGRQKSLSLQYQP
jgi:hypothetical protein